MRTSGPGPKLSAEFAARLEHLPRGQVIRAIVLLEISETVEPARANRRRVDYSRSTPIVRPEVAVAELDAIIAPFRGRRLSSEVSILGHVVVEATAEGIRTLATSPYVKAVLEDQQISLLTTRLQG